MSAEAKGINAIKAILEYNPYIDTEYLKGGEKYPSFDGELLIYNNSKGKKEGLNRVFVQIKTESKCDYPTEISYCVDCVDLNNYMRLGGCVYFVVRYNDKKRTKKVYYNLIYPVYAKVLLDKRKNVNQKTVSIKLIPFPEDTIEQSNLLLNFALDCIRQTSYVSSYNLQEKSFSPNSKYVINYSTYDKTINPAEYFLDKKIFLYRIADDGAKIPFDFISVCHTNEPIRGSVTVSGVPYYQNYSIVRSKNDLPKIFINSSFYFIFNTQEKKISYTYEIKGTLKARIKDLTFITEAFKHNGFEINGYKLEFESETAKENYKQTLNLLEQYKKIQQALDIAEVTVDLHYDRLTEKDINNLLVLEKIFLKKEALYNLNEKCVPFCRLRIANVVIPLYVTRDKNNKFTAVNVFDADIVIGKTGKEIEDGNVSVYCTKLSLEDLEEISNLNFNKMYNQIINAAFTKFHLTQTNNFLLQVILLYDKHQKEEIYNFAFKIASWLSKYNDADDFIFIINYLQLKLRKKDLSVEEIAKLIEICKLTDRNDIKFACLILLGKHEDAMKCFNLLDAEEQNYLKTLPIYKFVKKENTNG